MMTEVPPQDWKRLCEYITQNSQGSLLSIEEGTPEGTTARLFSRLPLQTMLLDEESNPCSNLLVIELGTEKPVRHEIVEPIHLLLKHGDNGRFNRLEIVAESCRTMIHFAPGLKSLAAVPSGAAHG